jgi:hypothetical protein
MLVLEFKSRSALAQVDLCIKCYGLLTRAYKLRILIEVSPKGNSKDSQQETLLVALIDDNVKLARRP